MRPNIIRVESLMLLDLIEVDPERMHSTSKNKLVGSIRELVTLVDAVGIRVLDLEEKYHIPVWTRLPRDARLTRTHGIAPWQCLDVYRDNNSAVDFG